VAANGAYFLAHVLLGGGDRPSDLAVHGALVPDLVGSGGEPWRLVSASFLHSGLWHLLPNVTALLALGPLVEQAYGHRGFLVLYVTSALGGALLSSVAWSGADVSAGASGALLGVAGAAMWHSGARAGSDPRQMEPYSPVAEPTAGLAAGPERAQRLLAWLLALLIAANLVSGLFLAGSDAWNHVGGLLCGLLVGTALHPATGGQRPRRTVGVDLAFWVCIGVLGYAGAAMVI